MSLRYFIEDSPAVAEMLKHFWGFSRGVKILNFTDKHGCQVTLGIYSTDETIVCTKRRVNRKELSVAETRLYLTPHSHEDWRKGTYSSEFAKKTEITSEKYDSVGLDFKESEKNVLYDEKSIRVVLKFYEFITTK